MPEYVERRDLEPELTRTVLAGDLLEAIGARNSNEGRVEADPHFRSEGTLPVIIEGNARLPGGVQAARALILSAYLRGDRDLSSSSPPPPIAFIPTPLGSPADLSLDEPIEFGEDDRLDVPKSLWTDQYLIGDLTEHTLGLLASARVTVGEGGRRVPLVHKVWLNHAVGRFVFESGRTVKCDAARASFAAAGEGITWAVADTGVDRRHPHFATHSTLVPPDGLQHVDFTDSGDPLLDEDGHGTHVAGVIAGETRIDASQAGGSSIVIRRKVRVSDTSVVDDEDRTRQGISGVAPRCRIISLKVLRSGTVGDVGTLLAAIGYVQRANDGGRDLRIHGLNLSLGYAFDARWFAAGQSPLCAEVNRLVRSGVVVVVAAGNGGYGLVQALAQSSERATHLGTITDPGNAELAVTVGSTHRDSPHTFGVSYFSAKGPTADGRMKPDVVAPGERIVSAVPVNPAKPNEATFREDSGTSMAAPHVSGAIAAFLSVRREFRGQPERIKQIFMASATDLGRRPEFQGAGLIDVMRALQSV